MVGLVSLLCDQVKCERVSWIKNMVLLMGNAGISVEDDSLNTHIINNITNLPTYEIIFNFLVVLVEKSEERGLSGVECRHGGERE